MIELIQLEQQQIPPPTEICIQHDTAQFHLDMYNKLMYLTVVTCEGQMLYWSAPVQNIVDAAVKRESENNKPKDEET